MKAKLLTLAGWDLQEFSECKIIQLGLWNSVKFKLRFRDCGTRDTNNPKEAIPEDETLCPVFSQPLYAKFGKINNAPKTPL